MAAFSEIDEFVYKFKQLLSTGAKSSLTLESCNGEAFVVLKAGIGSSLQPYPKPFQRPYPNLYPYNPHSPQFTGSKRNASYLKRQEKRRENKAEKKLNLQGNQLLQILL